MTNYYSLNFGVPARGWPDAYTTVADLSLSGGVTNFSVSFWHKRVLPSDNAFQLVGTMDYAHYGGWALLFNGAPLSLFMSPVHGPNGIVTFNNPAGIGDTNWHNYVLAYDSVAGVTLYFDGAPLSIASTSGVVTGTNFSSSVPFGLGDPTILEHSTTGLYAFPAFYFSTLTAGDAATIAAGANLAGAEAIWLLTEGSGTTAADTSGNAHTFSLLGPTTWNVDIPFTPSSGPSAKQKASTFLVF